MEDLVSKKKRLEQRIARIKQRHLHTTVHKAVVNANLDEEEWCQVGAVVTIKWTHSNGQAIGQVEKVTPTHLYVSTKEF